MSLNKHFNAKNSQRCEGTNVEEKIRELKKSINNSQLIIAASEGNIEELDRLIKEGADIDFKDSNDYTALIYAVIQGRENVVKYLLEKGVHVTFKSNDNKYPYDFAINHENENIIRILEDKTMEYFFKVAKNYKSKPNTIRSKVPSITSFKAFDVEDELKRTVKKIEDLYKRLENLTIKGDELSYEQANVFILFLETFAFQNVANKGVKKNLVRKFLNGEDHEERIITDTRRLIMKSTSKVISLCDIKKIIQFCFTEKVPAGPSEIQHFFCGLKKYVNSKRQIIDGISCDSIKLSSFMKQFPRNDERDEIGEPGDATDPFNMLKELVLVAYKRGENLEKHWFQFVVNVYPALGLDKEEKEYLSNIEIQIKHLRNNLMHEFYRHGIQEFREAIINLRGKLFEYYFAKRVHAGFDSLIPGKEVEDIKEDFSRDLKGLEEEFRDSGELLSEEEASNLFGYKFYKSIFPKQSRNINDGAVKNLVEEYFKFMAVIEDINGVNVNDSKESGHSVDDKQLDNELESRKDNEKILTNLIRNKKLNDVARRELFENFIRLKRVKDNFTNYIYQEEKQKLMFQLEQYGVENLKFNLVCKYYIEERNNLSDEIFHAIDHVVKFIHSLNYIKENDKDYKGKEIVFLAELLLSKDIVDKELILSDSIDLKKELQMKAQKNCKIMQLIEQVESFNKMCIPVGKMILEINVREAVKNILKTFGNAYNEYRVEFDLEDIFSRETFLNQIVWQNIKEREQITKFSKPSRENVKYLDTKTFFVMHKLINIDYMSPYIVKVIENQQNSDRKIPQIIDKNSLLKLMENLLNKEYISYLNILLNVKVENLNLYEELRDKIILKKIHIKKLRSIFKDLTHIDEFAKTLKLTEPNRGHQRNNDIELAKGFLAIINEEAVDRFHTRNYEEALKILKIGKEIKEEFNEVIENHYPDCIDGDILMARIKNRQKEHDKALEILVNVKDSLEFSTSINHKSRYLLALSEIANTLKLSKRYSQAINSYCDLYNKVLKHVLYLEEIPEDFDVSRTLKEKYNQIRNVNNYKNLLSSSEQLHSEKYLDILKIAESVAYLILKLGDKENGYKDALKIYEEIHSCYEESLGKDDMKTLQIMQCIASIYAKIGDTFKDNKKITDALICYQRAFIRYITVFIAQKNMKGSSFDDMTDTEDILINVIKNIAYTYNKLGDQKYNTKDYEEAQNNYDVALKMYEKVYNAPIVKSQEKHVSDTRSNIAYLHRRIAKCAMARAQRTWHDYGEMCSQIVKHCKLAFEMYAEIKSEKCENRDEDENMKMERL